MRRLSRRSQNTEFVGRDSELARIRDTYADVESGRGQLLLIAGEAGIGKSTLLDSFVYELESTSSEAFSGYCYDLTVTPPYGPWREILSQLQSTWQIDQQSDPLPDPRGDDRTVHQLDHFAGVHRVLAAVAAERPLIIVLEDIHWADPASLDLLRYLARTIDEDRIMLIASYRDDEISQDHPLFQLLPVLVREATPERIELRALQTDAISRLIEVRYALPSTDTSQLTHYLEKRTEGNPLFLHELLRSLEAEGYLSGGDQQWTMDDLRRFPVPPLIRQVIESRVARLEPQVVDVLETAAVIGERVSVDLWQQVSQADDQTLSTAVEQAIQSYILVESHDAPIVGFTHSLIREVLYQCIPVPRRRSLHRETGEALIARPDGNADAIAYHFQRAGEQATSEPPSGWFVQVSGRGASLPGSVRRTGLSLRRDCSRRMTSVSESVVGFYSTRHS